MQKSERKALCYKERQVQNYEHKAHNTPRSLLKLAQNLWRVFFFERKIAQIHMDVGIHMDARIHQKYLRWLKKNGSML